jgi:hypothetical protein
VPAPRGAGAEKLLIDRGVPLIRVEFNVRLAHRHGVAGETDASARQTWLPRDKECRCSAGLELRLFVELGAGSVLKEWDAGALKPQVLRRGVGDEFGDADQINVTPNKPLEKAIPITAHTDTEKLDLGRAN